MFHLTEPSSSQMTQLRSNKFKQMILISMQLNSAHKGNCSSHWDLLVVPGWWKPVHLHGDTRRSSILPLASLPAMPEQVNLAQKCRIGVRDIKGYSQTVQAGLEFAANGVASNKGHQSSKQCWKQKTEIPVAEQQQDRHCLPLFTALKMMKLA